MKGLSEAKVDKIIQVAKTIEVCVSSRTEI